MLSPAHFRRSKPHTEHQGAEGRSGRTRNVRLLCTGFYGLACLAYGPAHPQARRLASLNTLKKTAWKVCFETATCRGMHLHLSRWRRTLLIAVLACASCSPQGLQRQDQFVWAFKVLGSTAPRIVRIRIVDARSKSAMVRCRYSDSLVDAVFTEYKLPPTKVAYNRALKEIIANRTHTFSFSRPEALEIISSPIGMNDREGLKACGLIESGKSAVWGDMVGRVGRGPDFPLSDEDRREWGTFENITLP